MYIKTDQARVDRNRLQLSEINKDLFNQVITVNNFNALPKVKKPSVGACSIPLSLE
jgi:hypothetical protein